jgi:hypothetical protein
MVDRLNAIAYAHHVSGTNNSDSNYDPSFNPRSVSFDVRTPQELAAVNEFLLTLGRDVAGSGTSQRRSHQPVQHHGSSDDFSPHSYFDATSLSQLGLAGMPGMPASGASYNDPGLPSGPGAHPYLQVYHSPQSLGRSNHSSVQPSQFTSLYPSVPDSLTYSPDDFSTPLHSRHLSGNHEYISPGISPYHRNLSPQGHFHSTPPYDAHSPHSALSTPSNATPPHMPISMPDTDSFSFLREPRGPPPAVNLAPVNYVSRALREIVPLKTAPESQSSRADIPVRPEPVEPKLQNKAPHRGLPARLTSSNVSSLASSSTRLYPLLTSGDTKYKLPPLKRMYRSPSPASSPRSTADGDSTASRESSPASSPESSRTVLPSLRSIAHIRSPSDSDELAQQVGKIELDRSKEISAEDRRKHAELIRDLLVSINNDYKKRFNILHVKVKEEEDESMNLISSESPRDVEMTAA